jgi:hypothetical protein
LAIGRRGRRYENGNEAQEVSILRPQTEANGTGYYSHRSVVVGKVSFLPDRAIGVGFGIRSMGQVGQAKMTTRDIDRACRGGSDVKRTKKKIRKRSHWPKGVSDTLLQTLWRKAVLAEWGGLCALSESGDCQGSIECHHIKRRNIPHLKYAPENGIPLCQKHHALAKYRTIRNRIEGMVGPEKMEWLDLMEQKLFPVYLSERGMTRSEYLVWMKDFLTGLGKLKW